MTLTENVAYSGQDTKGYRSLMNIPLIVPSNKILHWFINQIVPFFLLVSIRFIMRAFDFHLDMGVLQN